MGVTRTRIIRQAQKLGKRQDPVLGDFYADNSKWFA